MSDPASRALQVRVNGAMVGQLSRTRDGLVVFEPETSWVRAGQSPVLGLAFLSDPSPRRAGTGLPAWFENLLPARDGALRRRICSDHGLRGTDSPGLLRVLGRDLPGAVEVSGEIDHEDSAVSPADAALRVGFSLAGMQLKFSMVRNGDRFALPARSRDGHWIVKIPSRDFPGLPEVEHATMAWAGAAGFPVPDHEVVPSAAVDGLSSAIRSQAPTVFVIRRFDRADGLRRIHQEDFAQALEIDPDHLYGDTGPARTSYDLLTRLVHDASGASAQAAYIERLAFVVASGNGDAHLKNWSFRWPTDSLPELSPLYDQVCTVAWPDYGWSTPRGPTLALALGRTRHFAMVSRERVGAFAHRGGADDGVERFFEALTRIRDAWPHIADSAPEAMRAGLQHHWGHTPVLREIGPLRA